MLAAIEEIALRCLETFQPAYDNRENGEGMAGAKVPAGDLPGARTEEENADALYVCCIHIHSGWWFGTFFIFPFSWE